MRLMKSLGTIKGSRVAPGESQAKDYGIGQVCLKKGCETILSRYNPLEFCAIHTPEPEESDPRIKKIIEGEIRSFRWKSRGWRGKE